MIRFFHRDVLFSTLFVFLVMYLLKLVVFNIEFLNPISHALSDFSFTDIYYSRLQDQSVHEKDTNIFIVNIGYDNREEIARKIGVINSFRPAVIGVDITFPELKERKADSVLANNIAHANSVVMASYFMNSAEEPSEFHNLVRSHQKFRKNYEEGYINFPSMEQFSTIRFFSTQKTFRGEKHYSFPVQISRLYNPESFNKLINRNTKAELIDYSGGLNRFHVLQTEDIDSSNRKLKALENKIVLLGFTGIGNDIKVLEDMFFTPLNPKFSGRSYPDMYGVVIHARIINTILNGNYKVRLPLWFALILSFLLTYTFMYLFIKYYMKWKIWYQLIVRVLQLVISIVFVALILFIYRYLGFKIDIVVIVIPVLLSIDVLEIYENIIIYLNKKYKIKTVFARND